MFLFKKILRLIGLLTLGLNATAQHTFSICAVDTVTFEVGSAGASCINNSAIISDLFPGFGVVHTQAAYIIFNQIRARNFMRDSLTPQEMLDSLIAGDSQPDIRQYGIVQLRDDGPAAAAYTGENCMDYKNHIIGRYYTIQGNILLGQQILDSMEARFLRTQGSLACKLMAALQGAKVAGADTRCLISGNSSLSAFLRVARPWDPPAQPSVDLSVPYGASGFEPIDSLQTLFDQQLACLSPSTVPYPQHDESLIIRYDPAVSQILFSGLHATNLRLQVFDACGRLRSLTSDTRPVETRGWPAGLYIWKLTLPEKHVLSGKIFLPAHQ
ncbi:MAG: hypothetical protein KatS3mg031_2051 [Chitinophagales bacterium]|nr:MAG: hypothetical protein KatS3mg031_2051 [Chitinophagales bacterium]